MPVLWAQRGALRAAHDAVLLWLYSRAMSPRRLPGPCVPGCSYLRGECPDHDTRSLANREGAAHRRERAAWQRTIDSGEIVLCRRCKQPIPPFDPTAWDLGHPAPKHPECRSHNRATMGRDRA